MAYTSSDLQMGSHQPLVDYQRWSYFTAGDSIAVIGASSYISDAAKRGVRAGDYVEAYCSSGPYKWGFLVKTVRTSIIAGSADLSSGMSLST